MIVRVMARCSRCRNSPRPAARRPQAQRPHPRLPHRDRAPAGHLPIPARPSAPGSRGRVRPATAGPAQAAGRHLPGRGRPCHSRRGRLQPARRQRDQTPEPSSLTPGPPRSPALPARNASSVAASSRTTGSCTRASSGHSQPSRPHPERTPTTGADESTATGTTPASATCSTASSDSSITASRPGSRSTNNAPSRRWLCLRKRRARRDGPGCCRPRRSSARPGRSSCLAQLGGETDGGLLPGSLPDQTLFGSCTKPDLRADLIGLQHSRGHHYGIQATGTAAGNNANRLVLARANRHGLDCAARPPEHTGDALHRIVERQGNKQIDLMDVFPHQLGHHPDQATTPTHRAKSSKLLSQDLVFALIHEPHPHR
jgi:hypothetical protein